MTILIWLKLLLWVMWLTGLRELTGLKGIGLTGVRGLVWLKLHYA